MKIHKTGLNQEERELWLVQLSLLILLLSCLTTGHIPLFFFHPARGSQRLFAHSGLLVLIDLLTVLNLILFLKNFRKMKQKAAEIMILLMVLFMASFVTVLGIPYFEDLAEDTETISTDFYRVGEKLVVFDEDTGEMLSLKLEKEPGERLKREKPQTDPHKVLKISDNISILGFSKTLKVTYYPHTHLVESAQYQK